jgi:hydrogenase nickel incorporation protein HypA/HybF
MHELAITQNVLEIVLRHARAAGGGRVSAIHLVVGELSSIVDESVSFYWDIIARDTPAEGARLHFRRIPARFRCQACGTEFPLRQDSTDCPACGSRSARLTAGDEFSVEAIEVDSDDPAPPE